VVLEEVARLKPELGNGRYELKQVRERGEQERGGEEQGFDCGSGYSLLYILKL
jgi:hypothetical protein